MRNEELELRAALRDGGRPAHHRGGGANGGRDALVTLTAGERHLDSVRDLMIHVHDVQMSGYRGASGSWAVFQL